MNKLCLVCNTANFYPIYNNTLLKCSNCGFVTAKIEVDDETIQNIYTENYFKGEEYIDYLRDKDILQANFRKYLKYILKKVDITKIKNVLEIGCAYGFFSEVINNELKDISYIGYDIVNKAIEYGKKQLHQNIVCGNYLKKKFDSKFTDVFMWDIIEHLPNPEKYIAKIFSETEKKGRLYITTGDISKLLPRIQKNKWRMIHPPSHLHYFSKTTLLRLLSNCRYKVIDVSYPSVSRSLKLIFYSLFMLRKNYSPFIEKIYNSISSKTSISLNTFDLMFVIAEKNNETI